MTETAESKEVSDLMKKMGYYVQSTNVRKTTYCHKTESEVYVYWVNKLFSPAFNEELSSELKLELKKIGYSESIH